MKKLERIEYKPIPVRDALIEMKDLSEVMIDLAYSAVLLHSHELTEEVLELEERVDYLSYMLNMNVMLAARSAEDAEALVSISTVAAATNEISDAAADIASLVIQEIGIHPIVREAFAMMEERLAREEVKSNSILGKKSLGELKLAARIGIDIIAIRRGKRWIIDSSEDETIAEGDIIIARGAPLGIERLKGLATGMTKEF